MFSDPFCCPVEQISGEMCIDACAEALITVARSEGAELVCASLGWYENLMVLLWRDRPEHELFEQIIEAAERQVADSLETEEQRAKVSAFADVLRASLS